MKTVGSDPLLAVVGGSGFYDFFDTDAEQIDVDTPYGAPSGPVSIGVVGEHRVAFLPRHGRGHTFSPHTIPYRANMWALRSLGVQRVFAPCAVGSLVPDWGPGTVVVPDQLVDRTSGRVQTFYDDGGVHVSFADPYCAELRRVVGNFESKTEATMVVVEGPRFSTRAESRWFAAQGWQLVNMTGHPEAVLARELGLCYAAVALVTDLDAGVAEGDGVQAAEVFAEFRRNIGPFKNLIRKSISTVDSAAACPECRLPGGVTVPGGMK